MILLDTCAIIWDALQQSQLTEKALTAITKADGSGLLMMSDISIWEIAMLMKKGRLEIDAAPSEFVSLYLQRRDISVVTISPEIAELSVNLDESINKDPADRIISATSIIHNAQLVTADGNLIASKLIDTIW